MTCGTVRNGGTLTLLQSQGYVNMGEVNIVLLGTFPYPHGMAVTRHAQLLINGLRNGHGVSIRVVILRQSSKTNVLEGSHDGISYETVVSDALRTRAALMAPRLCVKTVKTIRRTFRAGMRNILLVYGPPSWENVPAIWSARRLGFKIVFFIMEDDDLAFEISRNMWHRMQTMWTCRMTRKIEQMADGIAVISSHLEAKFRRLTSGLVPLHRLPILVDMNDYPMRPQCFGDTVTLFYSGSFGQKDGVPILLDAFEKLARRHGVVRLVLTGQGAEEAIRPVLARIETSPFKDRIRYLGCLDENAYYAALNAADIPCMTRINMGFANAGFPFKLGEFLATGKPTIASRVSDVGYLLEDRRDALLVEPGDSSAIVSAVEYLMADAEEAASMGRRGRQKACELFDYRKHGSAFLEFMGRL